MMVGVDQEDVSDHQRELVRKERAEQRIAKTREEEERMETRRAEDKASEKNEREEQYKFALENNLEIEEHFDSDFSHGNVYITNLFCCQSNAVISI